MATVTSSFDPHQFFKRPLPVSAETGINWDDYSRMGVDEHRLFHAQRRPAEWAFDDRRFREAVLTHCERWCNIRKHDVGSTHQQRLAIVESRAKLLRVKKVASIDSLCRRYVAEQDPRKKAKLGIQIRSLDAQVQLIDRGLVKTMLEIAWLWGRMGWESSAISGHIQIIGGPAVRQMIRRLGLLAEGRHG